MVTKRHVTLWFLRSVSARLCFTLYGGKFEGSLVEWLNPFCLHCNVCFLKAVLLQQIFHLQKMLPIIFRQQLDLTRSKEKKTNARQARWMKTYCMISAFNSYVSFSIMPHVSLNLIKTHKGGACTTCVSSIQSIIYTMSWKIFCKVKFFSSRVLLPATNSFNNFHWPRMFSFRAKIRRMS